MRAPIYVIIHYLQHAERLSASRLVLVGADEWARGTVSVKNLAAREQKEMSVAELLSNQEIGLKSEGKPSSWDITASFCRKLPVKLDYIFPYTIEFMSFKMDMYHLRYESTDIMSHYKVYKKI